MAEEWLHGCASHGHHSVKHYMGIQPDVICRHPEYPPRSDEYNEEYDYFLESKFIVDQMTERWASCSVIDYSMRENGWNLSHRTLLFVKHLADNEIAFDEWTSFRHASRVYFIFKKAENAVLFRLLF